MRSTARVIASKYFLILITGTRINTSGPHTTPHHTTAGAGMLQLDTCRGCSLRLDAAARHVLRCSLRWHDAARHVSGMQFKVGWCNWTRFKMQLWGRMLQTRVKMQLEVGCCSWRDVEMQIWGWRHVEMQLEVGLMLQMDTCWDAAWGWMLQTRVKMQLEVQCCS